MDPTAALTNALEALRSLERAHNGALPDELPEATENEREEAVDCLLGLAGWLRGKGFPPNVVEAIEAAGYQPM